MGLIHLLALLSPLCAALALFRVEQGRRVMRRAARRLDRYDRELGLWAAEHPSKEAVSA